MADKRNERRLAAIVAADVVGYSRLMGAEEEGTLNRLSGHLTAFIRPLIADHNGRLVKTTGDGLLIEFASVVEAVQCAVEMQQGMTVRNREEPEDRRIVFRIGINLGDVIIRDDDVYGDGVNVAARLEGLADPGGICLSRAARDQIRDRLSYALEDMGEIEVKNISRPVRAFRVLLDGTAAPRRRAGSQRRTGVVAGLVFLVAAIGGLFWLEPWAERAAPASVARMKLTLPDKPSVAVLPFRSRSENPDSDRLADAISEDVIGNLARVSGLFVIARNSSFTYKNRTVKVQQVAEELGVRHVIEGSVRHADDRIRVSVQLVDALSGHNAWSGRFDRELKDIFAVQDEITRGIATALAGNLTWTDTGRRLTENVEAHLLWRSAHRETFETSPQGLALAISLAEKAIGLDPGYSRAYALLGFAHSQTGYFGFVPGRKEALQKGMKEAELAVALAPADWYGHYAMGQALMNVRRYEEAVDAYDRAIALDPQNARLLAFSALPLTFLGRADEAIGRLQTSMRQNPFYEWHPTQFLGQALYIKERYEEAVGRLEEAAQRNPNFLGNWWWRAAAYSQVGRTAEAAALAEKILERTPRATISDSFIKISDPAAMARLRDGWRKAGLPE